MPCPYSGCRDLCEQKAVKASLLGLPRGTGRRYFSFTGYSSPDPPIYLSCLLLDAHEAVPNSLIDLQVYYEKDARKRILFVKDLPTGPTLFTGPVV